MNNKKIFCIGLNKTGTTTLHTAFQILGVSSVHWKDENGIKIGPTIVNNFKEGNDILKGLDHYTAFSDWGNGKSAVKIFKEFDKQYPGSKFILNTRSLDSWLLSREKHVIRNQKLKEKYPNSDITWLKVERKEWTRFYQEYHDTVLQYFKDRKNELLVFDVTSGDGWEKLCSFLNLPIPNSPFPKANVAPDKQGFIQRFYHRIINNLKILVKNI
jgi:hypothetical protein